MKKENGYIYIIKLDKYYKIGKSCNFKQRMGEYTCLYSKPKIIIVKWCRDYHNLEVKLHKKYKKYNTRGEWFKLHFWNVWTAKWIIRFHTKIFTLKNFHKI